MWSRAYKWRNARARETKKTLRKRRKNIGRGKAQIQGRYATDKQGW